MNELINIDDHVSNKIITIRNQSVILDSDVAVLYDVETKRVNEAIRNNPNKFPEGYVFELSKQEWNDRRAFIIANSDKSGNSKHLVENFDQIPTSRSKSNNSKHPVENFDQILTSGSKSDDLRKESLKSYVRPKAFTEKGLYMLATILKSPQATKATIEI
ncbi:MAG: ORF6N domain-containing protein, partial [Bacteroidales bacterium]|nr:ORF6N domain-containing protein [Bacteroidales bacterium]